MKWPFMLRKTHDEVLADQAKSDREFHANARQSIERNERARYEGYEKALAEKIDRILPHIQKCYIRMDPHNSMCITASIYINEHFFRYAHMKDEDWDYFAQRLEHDLIKRLRTIEFARVRESMGKDVRI